MAKKTAEIMAHPVLNTGSRGGEVTALALGDDAIVAYLK